MKGILIWVLAGALLGIAAASVIVPPMLSWYNEAGYLSQGSQPAAMVNLPRGRALRDHAADPRTGDRRRHRRGPVLRARARLRQPRTRAPAAPRRPLPLSGSSSRIARIAAIASSRAASGRSVWLRCRPSARVQAEKGRRPRGPPALQGGPGCSTCRQGRIRSGPSATFHLALSRKTPGPGTA